MHMHTERYGICCFCFLQKRKKITKKTLRNKLSKCRGEKQTALTLQSTRIHSITKELTWKTAKDRHEGPKPDFIQDLNMTKETHLNAFLFSRRVHQGKPH